MIITLILSPLTMASRPVPAPCRIKAKFYWDPKARFKHRLEKLGQTNSEITKLGVLKAGTQIEGVMDSYDSTLSELNGVKLPAS